MSQEEITRESFERRQEELFVKWEDKMTTLDKSDSKASLKFYMANRVEIFKDIEEFYDMAITLSIKGE
jgi:hypothetical protein